MSLGSLAEVIFEQFLSPMCTHVTMKNSTLSRRILNYIILFLDNYA